MRFYKQHLQFRAERKKYLSSNSHCKKDFIYKYRASCICYTIIYIMICIYLKNIDSFFSFQKLIKKNIEKKNVKN